MNRCQISLPHRCSETIGCLDLVDLQSKKFVMFLLSLIQWTRLTWTERSVSIPPSMITCATWMPFGLNSRAIDWANARKANFAAAKPPKLAAPRRLAVAPVNNTVPFPFFTIAGRTYKTRLISTPPPPSCLFLLLDWQQELRSRWRSMRLAGLQVSNQEFPLKKWRWWTRSDVSGSFTVLKSTGVVK